MVDNVAVIEGKPSLGKSRFADWFGHYSKEIPGLIRAKQAVKENEAVKQLKERFKEFKVTYCYVGDPYDNAIALATSLLGDLQYSAKDVTDFSLALAEFQDEERFGMNAGLFLSVLINNCKEDNFTVITEHLVKKLDSLGYGNTKHIIIHGDVGHYVGKLMRGGTLMVKGNAGDRVGEEMEGGEIVIDGDGEGAIGSDMKGGTITINGCVRGYAGLSMKGGSILIKGDAAGNVGNHIQGGVITVQGDAGGWVGLSMDGGSITINGDAGEGIGAQMLEGEIVIGGNAGRLVGCEMKKGTITIHGSAGDEVGVYMKEGMITIKGTAGVKVGQFMYGGTISIGQDIGSLDDTIFGGDIYHEGKLIVRDGKVLE